ncbi:MAG: hypothetical protein E7515_07130 [Ruminococcaceae bacterium]|nr:hypothetical protein [Oscillospiraceae bacterium]
MKLKSAIKYRYQKVFKTSLIFYILMLELVIGSIIVKTVNKSDFAFDEYFAIIMWGFTFVLGIISYTGELNMFLQNGVSRQTTHKSFIALLPVNFVFALISVLYDLFDYFITKKASNPKVEFDCQHIFPGVRFLMPESMFGKIIVYTLLVAVTYVVIMTFGYMLGSVSRSMKLFYKVLFGAVIIAIAVFFVVLYDYFSFEWFDYTVMALRSFFLGGYLAEYGRIPNFITALTVLCVINLSVSHLLINRATVRKGADRK